MWLLYCVLHSLLAASSVKSFFEKISGNFFRYYRLAYSIFATVSLAFLLYFQYSFNSFLLINSFFIKIVVLLVLVLPGCIIMAVSILKYFVLLSGVRTLYEAKPALELKRNGIHKYVRHPLYSGTLLFIWGLFFIFPMLNNLIAVMIITAYVLIGLSFEEKKLLKEFGSSYSNYISEVPMLLPNFKRVKAK
jgi:protein-S-isoprenylcysteine O-methyltransferase Ste14